MTRWIFSSRGESIHQDIEYMAKRKSISCSKSCFIKNGFKSRTHQTNREQSFFDGVKALNEHRSQLLDKRKQLDLLIANVEKTISSVEGGCTMTNDEKFEGFKQKMIDDNEQQYGKEIRAKYGDDTVNQSNSKVKNMTQAQHDEVTKLANEIATTLAEAFKTGNPASDLAQKAADLHKQWIMYYWPKYSKEAHAGLGQMYVDDERFTAYYDKEQPGTAAFLRDAIQIYTGMKS
jgi:membrane-associated HD superfamily phosphohydrolase